MSQAGEPDCVALLFSFAREPHQPPKVSIEDPIIRVLPHNIAAVRELLLDGEWVNRGILVRRLEQALSVKANGLPAGQAGLLEDIEVWLRAWKQLRPQPGGQ